MYTCFAEEDSCTKCGRINGKFVANFASMFSWNEQSKVGKKKDNCILCNKRSISASV